MMNSRRMRWAGNLACMREKRNAYRILVGKPKGKRPLGSKWEDNMRVGYTHMLVEREQKTNSKKYMKVQFLSFKSIYLFFNIVTVKANTFLPTCNKFFHSVTETFFRLFSNPGLDSCLHLIVRGVMITLEVSLE
jgi:hypothetical protein